VEVEKKKRKKSKAPIEEKAESLLKSVQTVSSNKEKKVKK